MKKLFTSTLLTVSAVPFLMAAPNAAKTQNKAADANQTQTTTKKVHKKNVKKSTATSPSAASTPSAPSTSQK